MKEWCTFIGSFARAKLSMNLGKEVFKKKGLVVER